MDGDGEFQQKGRNYELMEMLQIRIAVMGHRQVRSGRGEYFGDREGGSAPQTGA